MEGFLNEKTKKYLLIGAGVVLIGFTCWFVFCFGANDGGDVSNNGGGANAVTEQLDTTGKHLQDTVTGLDNIEQAVDRSSERIIRSETIIREVQVRTDSDEKLAGESAELINDSKRIVSEVRQRGKSQAR